MWWQKQQLPLTLHLTPPHFLFFLCCFFFPFAFCDVCASPSVYGMIALHFGLPRTGVTPHLCKPFLEARADTDANAKIRERERESERGSCTHVFERAARKKKRRHRGLFAFRYTLCARACTRSFYLFFLVTNFLLSYIGNRKGMLHSA